MLLLYYYDYSSSYYYHQYYNWHLKIIVGVPWWSSGEDSMLPPQGAQVQSLVQEVLHAARCGQKIKNKKFKLKNNIL